MNVFNTIKERLQDEEIKMLKKEFVNKKGIGVPFHWSVDISINEMIELSNSHLTQPKQKQHLKQKIQTYNEGAEIFGENRVLPVINKKGHVTIWID